MVELKPCPFCGCPLVGINRPAHPRVLLSVKCPHCHSHGGCGNTDEAAAAAWNERAQLTSFAERAVKLALERAKERMVKVGRHSPFEADVVFCSLSTPEAIAGIVKDSLGGEHNGTE